ncbi:MAG: HAD-IIB family hydrolase [Microbacterium sp.]|uniref:HAD family hydrolase n=1 Tax=Microbacterium sp. TaxID=51671 RepID=UPI001AC7B253|nr:HAD-IIB family hydrolase [Microbacterium sp.]MBN9176495.1 HAD-IIB family hydrolase [Microbacterium sp.]
MTGAGEAKLPPTGSIEIVKPRKVADLVEEIAADAEDPTVPTEPLLIALDVDGTVLLEDETLSPGVVEAIAHAHRAGHEVMLATGRSWEGTRGIQHVLALAPEYAVCSNGAVIMKRASGDLGEESLYERFHVETFDPTEVLAHLRDHLPRAKYMVELADGARLYTEPMDDWNLVHARRVTFAELSAQPVCRVVVVSPDESDEDFLSLVERIGLTKVSYAVGWSAWLDIAPQGVDKSTALEKVRTWLGVPPERVLVMGDGRNDVGMFRWALEHGGRAIAMGQGPDEVRREAGETTASVHSGGVADVLRAL